MSRTIVDLTQKVTNGMRSYTGMPAPSITYFLTHEESRARYQGRCELCFSHVNMVLGAGTYIDSPFHRDPTLPDLASMPLESAVDLPATVIDLRGLTTRAIRPEHLGEGPWRGRAVLLYTGMDAHWETDRYWEESPFCTEETADLLVSRGAALLGVDFLNVDDTGDPSRPVHTGLLRAGIPIVENLRNLRALPPSGFRFNAAPIAIAWAASFSVRAYAVVCE